MTATTNDTAIHKAVQQMNSDPSIGTTELEAAFSALTTALDEINRVNAARNAAIDGWAHKLRDLGMPDRGYEIDGQAINIYTTATSGHHLSVGSVSALADLAPFVVAATAPIVGNKHAHALPVDSLSILDRRAG